MYFQIITKKTDAQVHNNSEFMSERKECMATDPIDWMLKINSNLCVIFIAISFAIKSFKNQYLVKYKSPTNFCGRFLFAIELMRIALPC